jgi:hypothetical protein
MDGASFDRLSVVVHRLRDQATRRGALRLLVGGSIAAVIGPEIDDTEAHKRHRHKKRHKNCKGFGGRCNGNGGCCNGRCINGFCFPGNGGGGGGGGGNGCCRGFPNDYQCCRFNGVDICVHRNDFRCNGNICGFGRQCGLTCCQQDYQCCDSGRGLCCPDFSGWHCGDIACEFHQDADATGAPQDTMPFTEGVPIEGA